MLTIQADAANNALIIMAPEPVYNNLRAIIEKLDVRRAQVFVEALIVEVTADKAAEFGIQWQVLTGVSNAATCRASAAPTSARAAAATTSSTRRSTWARSGRASTSASSTARSTIPGIGTITNLGLLARALESDASANILSTPTLLTLDNEEARIIVGQNVPFITGQYATTGLDATVQPFQTIERRDVGLAAAREAADHRRRHVRLVHLPGSVARRRIVTQRTTGPHRCRSARSNRRWSSTTSRSSCSAA